MERKKLMLYGVEKTIVTSFEFSELGAKELATSPVWSSNKCQAPKIKEEELVFSEDFYNNKNQWELDTEGYRCQIQDGQLIIDLKQEKDDGPQMDIKGKKVKNFELTFCATYSKKTRSFGINIFDDVREHGLYFGMNSERYYVYMGSFNHTDNNTVRPQRNNQEIMGSINPLEPNEFKIIKNGKKFQFFINGMLSHEATLSLSYIRAFRFFNCNAPGMQVAVDYVTVRELKPKLKITKVEYLSEKNTINQIAYDEKGVVAVHIKNIGEGVAETVSCNLSLIEGYNKGLVLYEPYQNVPLIESGQSQVVYFRTKSKIYIQPDELRYQFTARVGDRIVLQEGSFPTEVYVPQLIPTHLQMEAEKHYKLAEKYTLDGKDKLALEHIDKALAIYKYDPYYNTQKGYILHYLEKYREGIDYCDKAIEIDSTNEFSYYARAANYRSLGKHTNAVSDLSKAIKYSSENHKVLLYILERGKTYLYLNNLSSALNEFNHILCKKPKDIDALCFRAITYNAQNQYDLAINDCNKALSISPNNQRVLKVKNDIQLAQQQKMQQQKMGWMIINGMWDWFIGGSMNTGGCVCDSCDGYGYRAINMVPCTTCDGTGGCY